MRITIWLLFIIWLTGCRTTSSIDAASLASELDSILTLDQFYREKMMEVRKENGWNSPSMHQLWTEQRAVDTSNLRRVMEIIAEVDGYPGRSLVGDSLSSAAFYVLQHAPDNIQEEYYELIMEAAQNNELDKRLAAMYRDRYLMHRGDSQIYGTQIRTEFFIDSLTGERTDSSYVWPIRDTTGIDDLRAANGLGSLEEYLRQFGLSRWD